MADHCCAYIVVSASSEDSNHRAINVAAQDLGEAWLTEAGEEKASVVLELQDSSLLHTIEIVNAGCTNVEIYVSNSPKQENEDTLLPTASMMTFSEMNSNVNTNRLRFFGPDKLTKGVSDKAWKYLRIVCMSFDTSRRPFGLARVRLFHSPPPSHYVASAVADNRSSMTTSPSSQPLPTCAPQKYIPRSKSFAGSLPNATKTKPDSTNNSKDDSITNNNNNTKTTSNKSKSINNNSTKRKRVIMNDDYDDTGGDDNASDPTRSLTSTHISSHKSKSQPVAASQRSKSLVFTPFYKLMSDVSIVVSGIANPARQELRDKAIEMGAKYYPDWIESATHLICRFNNTPKFISAQEAGASIVTPAWILDCHKSRSRLPETEYLMAEVKKKQDAGMKTTVGNMRDWLSSFRPSFNKHTTDGNNNTNNNNSNNINTRPKLTRSLTFINNARIIKDSQSDSDVDDTSSASTEPMSDNDNTNNDNGPPIKIYKKDSGLGSALTDTTEDMGPTQDTVELLTSEDERLINKQGTIQMDVVGNKSKKSGVFDIATPLPSYFKHITAVLFGHFDPALRMLLLRYLTAYSGDIEDKVTDKTTHVITNQVWDEELRNLQDKHPSACIVRPSWVFDSHNEQRKVDAALHRVQEV